MKTGTGSEVKFAALAIVAGGLIGSVIPLPRSGAPHDAVRPPVIPARQTASAAPFPVPAKATPEWAASCAASGPREFFHWLLKEQPQPPKEIVEAFFSAWIARDPDSAFRAALLLPARFGYTIMESQYFPREVQLLFRRDPLTALRWVGRIEGAIGHDITLHMSMDLYETLGPLDPVEVRTWLNRSPVGGVSVGMAKAFAETLAAKDPDAAVRWTNSLNVEYQNAVLPMMLYHLSKKDPEAAMEYIRNAPSHIKQYCALFAMQPGSSSDIIGQMKWLEQEMGVASYTGLNNLMSRLYGTDPSVAIEQVKSMEGSTQGMDAVRGLAEAACYSGPTKDAVAMIVTLPGSLQLEAARSAMSVRMPGDFAGFMGPLVDNSINGPNLDGYIGMLANFVDGEKGTWSVADVPEHLAAFQDWIRDHPGPGRDRFIREAAEVLRDKPELKDKVFGSLPPEELKMILADQ